MDDDVKSPNESRFNAAVASLIRMDKLLTNCNEYRCAAKTTLQDPLKIEYLAQWKANLEAFYCEIVSKLDDSEREDINKLMKSDEKFGRIAITRINSELDQYTQFDAKVFNRHYQLLNLIDMKLRIHADKHKLLIPNAEDQRFAMAH